MAGDWNRIRQILPVPDLGDRKQNAVTAGIVTAAIWEAGFLGRRISYSRRRDWYRQRRRYLHNDVSRDRVCRAVEALISEGILVDHVVAPAGVATGWQSTFRPAPALAQVDAPSCPVPAVEVIRLRDEDGDLIDYVDTERTHRERRFLRAFNEALHESTLDFHSNWPGTNDVSVAGCHRNRIRLRFLYRVFNVSWTRGGRFYGGWWQGLPRDARRWLVLDGEPTVELDYAQIHPRLLYKSTGQSLDGDAYDVPGWRRPIVKIAFNILLNAMNIGSALGAIQHGCDMSCEEAARLIDAIKIRHDKVRGLFHSGIGLKLQSEDARMAKVVMNRLLLKAAVGVYPIHDSFIVASRQEGMLREAMAEAETVAGLVGDARSISIAYTKLDPQCGVSSISDIENARQDPRVVADSGSQPPTKPDVPTVQNDLPSILPRPGVRRFIPLRPPAPSTRIHVVGDRRPLDAATTPRPPTNGAYKAAAPAHVAPASAAPKVEAPAVQAPLRGLAALRAASIREKRDGTFWVAVRDGRRWIWARIAERQLTANARARRFPGNLPHPFEPY